ncbi:MAG: hypothetical protein ABR571_18500 [Jatrophihabitans sp.]|uniref:hypothetical protein n=1 Tax=Jatrophihabitans sp. TaxID=1932789 RepID=UPI00391289D1
MPQETRSLRRTAAFQLADRPGRPAGVRLAQEIGLAEPLDFVRTAGVWRLDVELPDVARMEYLFEIRDGHGARTTIPDPANPRRALAVWTPVALAPEQSAPLLQASRLSAAS